jgi:serine protease Do
MQRWAFPIVLVLGGVIAGSQLPQLHSQNQTPEGRAPQRVPEIVQETASYRDVVKRVLPAVVSVESRPKAVAAKGKDKDKGAPRRAPADPRVPEEFRRFFEEFGGGLPEFDGTPMPQRGFGSGFFVDPKGVIVTNNHVVEGAATVTVTLQDGRKFKASDIRGDQRTDLAVIVLDIKNQTFPYLEFGESSSTEIGDRVLAVGAPFGLTGTVTQGIVSAKGRSGLNMNFYEDFIQTDAAINPGNSGGPLVTLDGKVVGINSAIKSRSGGFQGVGLAVASHLAKDVVKALKTDGVVRRGYLGVQISDLDDDIAERLGVKEGKGVVVGDVFENTPASKAGLQSGDVITAIDGANVKDSRTLQHIIAYHARNKEAELAVVRDGKNITVPVTIEEQPKTFGVADVPARRRAPVEAESIALDKIGIEVSDLSDDDAENLGYRPGVKGVLITRVEPDSVASEAGLRRGMVITRIDRTRVAGAEAAQKSLQSADLGRGVLLQVQSPQGGTNFVLLKQES